MSLFIISTEEKKQYNLPCFIEFFANLRMSQTLKNNWCLLIFRKEGLISFQGCENREFNKVFQ